jgi:mannan endo-1,4-beta-mannosidase
MSRRTVIALATPAVAALAIATVLVVTHHTTVPPLTPSSSASGTGGTSPQPGPARHCEPAAISAQAVDQQPAGQQSTSQPFLGIATNPDLTGHVRAFQAATGAHMTVVEYYNPFVKPFQKWEAMQAVAVGAMPFIQLNPRNISLSQIAQGSYNAHIRQYARAVRAFGCPVMLSFGHEMNGWWYSWGRPDTSPAAFKAAWRRIYDIFSAEHVTNATWSWDPTHAFRHGASPASEWFPGNAYVNVVGIDGYLQASQNFAYVFAVQLRNIRRITSKPVFIAETGVAGGLAQSWQIHNLFASLNHYHLAGLVWFDVNGRQPWRLQGRPAALAAYRNATASRK